MTNGPVNAPTSPQATNTGEKVPCPYLAKKTCHVKKLKVKITPKKSGEAPKKAGGAAGEGAEGIELEANEKINRYAMSLKGLEDRVKKGEAAEKKGEARLSGPTRSQQQTMKQGEKAAEQLSSTHSTMGRWFDKEAYALLARYDLVLETLATFPQESGQLYKTSTARVLNTVDIKVEAEAEGTCSKREHFYLTCRANSATRQQDVTAVPPPVGYSGLYDLASTAWPREVGTVELQGIHAAAVMADVKSAPTAIAGLIKLLCVGWQLVHPMDLEFVLQTCGRKEDSDFVPVYLNALVRVYRETSFTVGIRVPPFKKYEAQANLHAIPAGNVATINSTSDMGMVKHTQKTNLNTGKRHWEKKEDVSEFDVYIRLNEIEVSLNELREEVEPLVEKGKEAYEKHEEKAEKEKLKKALGKPKNPLSFAHQLAIYGRDIKKAWGQVGDILRTFFESMQRLPQCGYSFKFEMSFLEGYFEASVFTSQGKAEPGDLGKRYVPIKWKAKLAIGTTVLTLKGEASFGLLIDFKVGRVDVRVVGQIVGTIEAKVETEFAKGEDTEITLGLGGTVGGRLFAVAALETVIYTWKREIGIEAGIKIEGQVKFKAKKTEHTVKAWTLPVQWYFVAVNSYTNTSEAKLHTLYTARPLFEWSGLEAEAVH